MSQIASRSVTVVLVLAWLSLGASLGHAQPQPQPAPPAVSAPVQDTRALYERAYADLLAGRFDAAIAGFDQVAASDPDPGQRVAARELARLARELGARGVQFAVAPAPGEPLAPGAAPAPGEPLATGAAPAPGDSLKIEPGWEDPAAGRTSFVISTTLAGAYGGIVFVDLLDIIDDFRPTLGAVLGGTAVGFLGSYYGSRGQPISEAMADAYSLGMTLGAGNALLLSFPLGIDQSENVQLFTFGSLALAGAGGMWLAHDARPTRGQVFLTNITSMLGLATAGLGLLIVQPEFDSEDPAFLTLVGGLDAGTATGLALVPRVDWSLSRARLIGLGTFLGGLMTWGATALLTGTDSDGDGVVRLWSASGLLGLWGGFGLSTHLTRRMEPDPRYLDEAATSTLVMPLAVPGGLGLGVSGQF
ncbi:MAG TPA: hypothetical protein VNM90_09060 [Haliangium sp.]|nr:hypothetical protein [Haliangium sp.]